jgi:hypothetical protein
MFHAPSRWSIRAGDSGYYNVTGEMVDKGSAAMTNWRWDPSAYGPEIGSLLNDDRLAPINGGRPNPQVKPLLEQLSVDRAFGHAAARDPDMAACCLAGLWLLHGYLDESHKLSQDIHTTSGSYWHGLMHRREGDFSNSKYWFRQVGQHPVFPILLNEVRELTRKDKNAQAPDALAMEDRWDPYRFIDMCESASENSKHGDFCELVQQAEWRILFDYCYRQATGNAP